MTKIVAFGEIMLRLSTEQHLRFSQASSFAATYGGGEFNVAVSLANFGISTEFTTKIPSNDLGYSALKEMRKCNVGTEHVVFGGDRLGIYFLETGSGMRSSNVVYDRANSAIATAHTEDFNWTEILKEADWFHFSGITPGISDNAAQVCLEAVKSAHKLGITISCDLNYRSKLWKYGKLPSEVMPELLKYCNIIIGDIDTAFYMLGKEKVTPNYNDKSSLSVFYAQLFECCPNLKLVATTLRYSISASHQRIGGILFDGKSLLESDVKDVNPVVDRVGSGDAFMGGLIYGLLTYKHDKQKALDFAVAHCCLKHTISGDYSLVTVDEVEKILQGESDGTVSR